MQTSNKKLKESTPVHTIVRQWIKIIQEKGHPNTLIVFDCYYFSSETRILLLQNKISACASVNINKYPAAVSLVSSRITQAGDIEAVFNEDNGEMVIGYFNPDPKV